MADNAKIVRAIEEAWDRGELDALDQYFSPEFNSHSAIPQLPAGLAGAKMAHGMSMQAFPDRKTEIVDLIADGDKVVVRMRTTGTNKGGLPWLNVPANNAKVDFEWISIYRLNKGQVVEHWGLNDVYTLGIQLGAIPAPPM